MSLLHRRISSSSTISVPDNPSFNSVSESLMHSAEIIGDSENQDLPTSIVSTENIPIPMRLYNFIGINPIPLRFVPFSLMEESKPRTTSEYVSSSMDIKEID